MLQQLLQIPNVSEKQQRTRMPTIQMQLMLVLFWHLTRLLFQCMEHVYACKDMRSIPMVQWRRQHCAVWQTFLSKNAGASRHHPLGGVGKTQFSQILAARRTHQLRMLSAAAQRIAFLPCRPCALQRFHIPLLHLHPVCFLCNYIQWRCWWEYVLVRHGMNASIRCFRCSC